MAYITRTQKFLSSDFTVPINKTAIDGTDFTSNVVDLFNAVHFAVVYEVKGGNSGCSQNITFKLASSYDGINWDDADNVLITQTLAMSGTNQRRKTVLYPHYPCRFLKLYSVQNPETSTGYTATVNAIIIIKEER